MALLGASGCGKSMTLGCIAGIVRPDKGHIGTERARPVRQRKENRSAAAKKRKVGYLFQQYALFPHTTVEQNIRAGTRRPKTSGSRRCAKFCTRSAWRDWRTTVLSFPRRTVTAVGRWRAFWVGSPSLCCLDEPFSALDAYLKWQVELELSGHPGKNLSCGTLFVTHNRDEVYRLCDTVCVLNKGKSDPKETVKELFRAPATMGAALDSGCKNVSAAEVKAKVRPYSEGLERNAQNRAVCAGKHRLRWRSGAYFTTEGTENAIPCARVERVVENPFSTVVMRCRRQAQAGCGGSWIWRSGDELSGTS